MFSKDIPGCRFVELFTVSADFLPRPVLVNLIIACDILSTHHKQS